jgi:antitoxin component HigA of HigAB toxin-antitoxin module
MTLDTDDAHAAALAEAEQLMHADPPRDTDEGRRLLELAEAIEAYERIRWPMPDPTPEEAAAFRREQEEDPADAELYVTEADRASACPSCGCNRGYHSDRCGAERR